MASHEKEKANRENVANMKRLRGRCELLELLRFFRSYGHWLTVTIILSIRWDQSTVCMTIDGAAGTETFRAGVSEVLLPTIKPGDLVIMENPTPHEKKILALIEGRGVSVWFLPAYSQDLNLIEKMSSKVKQASSSLEPQIHEQLWDGITHALYRVALSDTEIWFAWGGYSII